MQHYKHVTRFADTSPSPYVRPVLIGVVALTLVWAGNRWYGARKVEGETAAPQATVIAAVPKVKRVGIQAGHWKNQELPGELNKLYWSTGASAGGVDEVDVNLDVAQKVAALLEAEGIVVDVIPATVPERYTADAFVSIHADGNEDTTVSGYKVASSMWDTDGRAQSLSESISSSYGNITNRELDSQMAISDDMTQYYAFNFGKYVHSVDASTPAVLVEIGYVTNKSDRSYLTNSSQKVAQGVADGILHYLKTQE